MSGAVHELLATLTLALMRPLGVSLLFPILQVGNLGSQFIRNGVLMALAIPVLPLAHDRVLQDGERWMALIPEELLLGLILGFIVAIPFWAVDMAGFMIDTLRGATMSTVFNPTMAAQSSIFGMLFNQLLCAFFFLSEGVTLFLSVIYDSYRLLPPGKGLTFGPALFELIQIEWQLLYRLCLGFSLPVVVVLVLVDLAMGLLNRSAKQLNVFFLAMPIKSALALLLLLLSLPLALDHHQREIKAMYQRLGEWIAQHE
ncbi:EscT/YscT/HrcT family type III secretion system export apparatus protein [unidentified bacterial endosymbiont]|jgi:type III secretion protein T|uniref:EscT/YscT/HrcT family type III secretion system export apparatus protein n=1 Tax=unidentified bacterial endosymbiont TaxID=2355 RepID=UPI0020A21A2A|nr:EscT/YscT/HrcT family type III secretion system export apparatus protein [unidentified bacterial endosymbiont]